ncbi:MAG: acyltransferase [Lachnospiraceae bacterium]|nr:acyltransferase [Lachnospiraceae bacterium]
MEFILRDNQKEKIQVARAVAIFMVIVTHTVLFNPYEIYVRPFVNPAVGIFVFLSGLLTKEQIQGKDILTFYKRRLLRVFIPYTLWSIVYVVFQGSYDTAIIDYLTGNCCSTFYYILVYMQLVIIAPLVGKLIRSKLWWIGFIITPVAIVTEYILVNCGIDVIYPYNINNFFVWFIFFYMGMLIRIRYKSGKEVSSTRINVISIVLIPVCIALELLEGHAWLSLGRTDFANTQVKLSAMLTGMVVCIFIASLILSKSEKRPLRLLVLIGDASFGIYLIHQLIIGIWGRYFSNLIVASDYWFIIEAVVVLIIASIIILVSQKIFGKKIGRLLGVY